MASGDSVPARDWRKQAKARLKAHKSVQNLKHKADTLRTTRTGRAVASAAPHAAEKQLSKLVRQQAFAYRRLLAATLQVKPEDLWEVPEDGIPRELELESIYRAKRAVTRPALDQFLLRGASLDEAMVQLVRGHLRRGEHV